MKLIQFYILFVIIGCSQPREVENPEKLSSRTESSYSYFKNRSSVIGYIHYQTCEEESYEHISYLRDSTSKTDLLYMLNDSCEKAFKVFLVEEIHKDFPEMDSLILSKYGSDSTEIRVVTSCIGIVEIIKFGDICKNIILYNSININPRTFLPISH